MDYFSTRGGAERVSSAAAILKGLASDGGLFVPASFPQMPLSAIEELAGLSYEERAVRILHLFLTDYTEKEIEGCVRRAYGQTFDDVRRAPVTSVGDLEVLELWHGPTSAFKDMALQLLPQLMSTARVKQGEKDTILILVATSGDTGKAALEGFADAEGIRIMVFYPDGGVSPIQRLQMVTQAGDNVRVVAVRGNFDDAQRGVKEIFGDAAMAAELAAAHTKLSSANSINWGRLVPQIVYYFSAYADLLAAQKIQAGDTVNFTVPTGNFGNILAAYFAKRMGLPIDKLICASNDNKVLFDFFETGVYDKNREFILTTSPSMDILVSSNLERLLYLSAGCDAAKTKALMEELQSGGKYALSAEMRAAMADFTGGFATQEEVAERIRSLYEKTGYVIDTHTAVASKVYEDYRKKSGDTKPTVIASTASPFKFSRAVMEAIAGDVSALDDFAVLDELREKAGLPFPPAVEEIRNAEVRHTRSCKPEEMKEQVREILFS